MVEVAPAVAEPCRETACPQTEVQAVFVFPKKWGTTPPACPTAALTRNGWVLDIYNVFHNMLILLLKTNGVF